MSDYTNTSQPMKQGTPMNNNSGGGSTKTLKIVIFILVVALIGCLIALYSINNKSEQQTVQIETVTSDKDRITAELTQLKGDYDDLRTNNDTINAQLTKERKKIDLLLDKIKRTDANNRSKLKEYEGELGSLRLMLKGYVAQIDSLDHLNKQLRAENSEIKQQADESKKKIDELSQKSDNLQSMVEKGSVLKIRDIAITAVNNKDKDVSKARQVSKIRTCFSITANNIANKGLRSVYVRIKSPDGSLLANSADNLFDVEGSRLVYSAMREIDYQGEDLEICLFYTDKDFLSGTYTVEIYMNGALVGTSQLLLK